jgi:nucleoside-diphosphate-sugar epimerase
VHVTVFGGTGKIGRFVVERLLADGHAVTTLVRSPDKLDLTDPALTVVAGELTPEAIDGVVAGADAVISALGPPIDPAIPGSVLTDATRSVIEAMHAHGVRRLVALATVSVPDPHDRPGIIDRLVPVGIGTLIPGALREVQGIHEAVTTSDLDWTVVRIFAPIDIPSNETLRAGYLGVDDLGTPMARVDIAAFMVDQLTDTTWVGAAPAISN